MKHADIFYDDFLRQFIHHFENKEKMDKKAFKNVLKEIGLQETQKSILKSCSDLLNKHKVDSYDNTRKIEDEIIENHKLVEKLIYYYMNVYEERLTKDILIQLLHYIGNRLFIYTFSPIDKIDYDFYYDLAHQASDYFKINIQTDKAILDEINFLRRNLYLTMHKLEFLTVPYRFKDTIQLVLDDVKYSQKLNWEHYLQALNNYTQINIDHLLYSINKSEPYIDLKRLSHSLLKFKTYLQKYIDTGKTSPHILFDSFSSYFKMELYDLKVKIKQGESISESFKIRLFLQAAKLISVFYGRIDGYQLFFDKKEPAYKTDLKSTLTLFSRELLLLLNEEKLNVFEPLYLVFTFLNNFNEYSGLNKNVYQRLKFITQSYNRRTYYLLSTTLYLKLLNDRKTFLTEVEKVKKNIEASPTITLITLYNNEIETMYDLDTQTKNNIKIDPYIMTIMDCISQISKNINAQIIKYKKEHEEDEDYFYRKQFIDQFENENLSVLTLARDPNLFRGLNQFYSSFLNSFLKNMKMDFREDFIKKLDQIKIELLDLNPLDLQISLILSRLWKLLVIFKMNDPKSVSQMSSSTEDYFNKQNRNIDKVMETFFHVQGHHLNGESIKSILIDMTNPTRSGSTFLKPGSRMLKVTDGLISKILETGQADTETIISLYEDSFYKIRKQWIYDPIMLYYINYYLSSKKNIQFYKKESGDSITPNLIWVKKGEIVLSINSFIDTLFLKTTIENDMGLELEKLSQMNHEVLVDDEGQKKIVTQHIINKYIKENKTIIFEKVLIEDQEDLIYLSRILEYYLKNVGKSSLLNNFKYIITELINNANRGILKRAHFKSKSLDLERNYQLGMKDFQEKYKKEKTSYVKIAREIGLKVNVQFQVLNNILIVSVINNYKIQSLESEEINKRYQISRKCKSLQEIQKMNLATDEGKGQGLAILNLLLTNIGLDENFLKMRADEDQTLFRIHFPLQQLKEVEASTLAVELTRELENIPTLPANIVKLTQEINNPDSSIDDIEFIVSKDPPLAARIIQMANSPLYLRMEKVRNLKEAIQMIGLKGLGSIILTYSSYQQLEGLVNVKRLEQIIHHSEQTAFFAKELIKRRKLNIPVENVYLPALIHDIGKIVIECRNPNVYNRINELSRTKNIPVNLIEDLFGGLYHNLVGYELAKKWGFPEVVSNIIKYHHDPRSTDEYYDEIFLIYLANELTRYCDGAIIFENLDQNVLEFFEITSQDELNRQVKELAEAYREKSS